MLLVELGRASVEAQLARPDRVMKCEKCGRLGSEFCEVCERVLRIILREQAGLGFGSDYGGRMARAEAMRRTESLLRDPEIWEVVVQAHLCGLPPEAILGLVRGHAPVEFDL